MLYQKIDSSRYQIMPEPTESVKDILLAFAKVSYETAIPRGLGLREAYLHTVDKSPDLEACIETKLGRPVMLLMDYINGRDCRTKVYKNREGKWYFDVYAFKQRKMTSEEFMDAVVGDGEFKEKPEEFLTKVNEELRKISKNK